MLFRAKRLKERDERKEGCIHIFLHLDAVDTIAGKKTEEILYHLLLVAL
jgi:hypothetical protein